jgi:hypothetical protein
MANYHFVNNADWNEHILPLIFKINRFDVRSYVQKLLRQNPNALWSSTSNTTFRVDIFDEYMRWFQPIAQKIKDTRTCGHAHERSITYFSFIKNKKLALTNNLLKHYQMDSHKTQGHEVNVNLLS